MADVTEEQRATERFRREMAMANEPRHIALHAHDSIGTLLLAILDELREIKAKLPNA